MTQEPTSSATAGATTGFFGWIRSLGLIRENGWVGGVCGGVADRLGIDPIIVRGIAVVVALLGGPAILFYAAGWALLPDTNGRIHLERVLRGIFEPAAIAIVVLAVLAFLPIVQSAWWSSVPFGSFSAANLVERGAWSLLVLGLIVAFIVWAARGFPRAPWGDWPRAAATGDATGTPSSSTPTNGGAAGVTLASAAAAGTLAGTAAANPGAGAGAGEGEGTIADVTRTPPTDTLPTQPVKPEPPRPIAPDADASAAELEDWKQAQASWKANHDAWKAQQALDARALREQKSAASHAAAAERAARADERCRLRARTNPRAGGIFVFATIGLALVIGAASAATALGHPGWREYSAATGFAAATLVCGLALVLAGILRRRSGFLVFVSIVLILITLTATFAPGRTHLDVFDGASPGISSPAALAQGKAIR